MIKLITILDINIFKVSKYSSASSPPLISQGPLNGQVSTSFRLVKICCVTDLPTPDYPPHYVLYVLVTSHKRINYITVIGFFSSITDLQF